MKSHIPRTVALSLAACALAAKSEPVTVSAGGSFTLAPFGANPVTTNLQFTMDNQVTGHTLQPVAFVVNDLAVRFSFGSLTKTITENELGWFDDGTNQYTGYDFRLHDVLVPATCCSSSGHPVRSSAARWRRRL